MNSHGFMIPDREDDSQRSAGIGARAFDFVRRRRMLFFLVILPTLIAAIYLFVVASDQYESESHYLVKSVSQQQTPGIGISQLVSAASGLSGAQSESMSVADYLSSHDVVARLQQKLDITAMFQRSNIDPVSRLYGDPPSPERLLRYYRSQVKVEYNSETGITTLRVRSFRPEDSLRIVQELMSAGEARVNSMNERSYHDTIASSERQLTDVESHLEKIQVRLTGFRQGHRDIDPQASGQAQISLVSKMSADLSMARAQLASMGSMIRHDSPQYLALASRVRALEAQQAAQSQRLTGPETAIAADIGGYEDLRLRQSFLAKRYETASAALEKARETARNQQLYLVRVVEPNLPQKSLFPQRWRVLATIFFGLLLAYSIGWLIAAGVREHAA